MNVSVPARSDLTESFPVSTPDTAADRLVLILLTAGLIASMVMRMTLIQAIESQLKPGEFYSPDIVKPALFYVAHGLQLILLLSAGIIALLTTDFRNIERGALLRFGLFLAAGLLMTGRGYTLSDLLSTKFVDASGPVPCLMSLLVFVGAKRKYWGLIAKAMVILAVFCSVAGVLSLVGLQLFTRDRVIASLGGTLNVLYWPAAWIALTDYPPRSTARSLRFVPLVIYTFLSFFTQTRLNFVMVIGLLAVLAYIQHRRKAPQAAVWMTGAAMIIWGGLFTSVFLKDTSAFQVFEFVADAFSSRIDEDSRTGQLVRFAENVSPQELILGRGALATWDWGKTVNWRGGTDVGYLTLLLYGGLPLLLTYIAFHLKPAFSVLRANPDSWQLTAAGIVMLWGLRMFSSSYMGVTIDYYPVLFCVGACISREPFQYGRRSPLRADLLHKDINNNARALVYE